MQVTEQGVPIEDLIKSIKHAIVEAGISSLDHNRDLRISSVHLTLHAIATRSLGYSLKFCIPFIGMAVKLGNKITMKDTHRIEIELAASDLAKRPEVREGEIESVLTDAVDSIRAAVAAAASGDDPFTLTTSTVELSFAVTADGSISLGVDGALSDELTHKLTLTLVPT